MGKLIIASLIKEYSLHALDELYVIDSQVHPPDDAQPSDLLLFHCGELRELVDYKGAELEFRKHMTAGGNNPFSSGSKTSLAAYDYFQFRWTASAIDHKILLQKAIIEIYLKKVCNLVLYLDSEPSIWESHAIVAETQIRNYVAEYSGEQELLLLSKASKVLALPKGQSQASLFQLRDIRNKIAHNYLDQRVRTLKDLNEKYKLLNSSRELAIEIIETIGKSVKNKLGRDLKAS